MHTNKKVDSYWIYAKGLGICVPFKKLDTAILNYEPLSIEPMKYKKPLKYDQIKITGKVNYKK